MPALVGLALLAVFVTSLATFIDRVTVTSHAGLGHLAFGYPLGWLAQNQSALMGAHRSGFRSEWCPSPPVGEHCSDQALEA